MVYLRVLSAWTEVCHQFLMAEKCKPCEINRKMCDVYGEACFNQNNVYKKAKYRVTITSLSQKTEHGVETHWLSCKVKCSRHSSQ